MRATIRWRGRQIKKNWQRGLEQGLRAAALFFHTQCRLAVSRPNTGKRVTVKRKRKGGNKRSRTVYPNPSKPGQPPRLRTGFGRRNITWERLGAGFRTRYRVGVRTNAQYMAFLELGTRRVRARPWLKTTLERTERQLKALAQAKWK